MANAVNIDAVPNTFPYERFIGLHGTKQSDRYKQQPHCQIPIQ